MAGLLPDSKLTDVLDGSNMSFVEAGQEAGYSMVGSPAGVIEDVRTRAADIGYFVELHIEQGVDLFVLFTVLPCFCLSGLLLKYYSWCVARGVALLYRHVHALSACTIMLPQACL
jgi:hypothetical protein